MNLPPLTTELICRVEVDLDPILEVGQVGGRSRRVIPIVGGRVFGHVQATILSGGTDWQWVDDRGVATVDTRYAMRTDDGALVTIATVGYRHGPADVLARVAAGEPVDPNEYYFRVTARFETSASQYDWLNRTLFVAVAAREADRVVYDLYAVR